MSATPTAIVRPVSASINECELTHLASTPIDVAKAHGEHAAYVEALAALGFEIEWLPAADDLPDAVFVEDTAIVLDEVALITRPGAPSRRRETASTAAALARFRPLRTMTGPATLDGGDVLRIGRTLYVGDSTRSNAAGWQQLAELVRPFGYRVQTVPLRDCLHLKSTVTQVGPDQLLLNPAQVDGGAWPHMRPVFVDPAEPSAANALWLEPEDTVVFPAEYPRTAARLAAAGVQCRGVPAGELARAEGGVTCCSLIVRP